MAILDTISSSLGITSILVSTFFSMLVYSYADMKLASS